MRKLTRSGTYKPVKSYKNNEQCIANCQCTISKIQHSYRYTVGES